MESWYVYITHLNYFYFPFLCLASPSLRLFRVEIEWCSDSTWRAFKNKVVTSCSPSLQKREQPKTEGTAEGLSLHIRRFLPTALVTRFSSESSETMKTLSLGSLLEWRTEDILICQRCVFSWIREIVSLAS